MKSQIFKTHLSKDILIELLKKICSKGSNYYILNKISYKKADYSKLLDPFYQEILPYYHDSKQYYISRKSNYTSFITIVRQICKLNLINYTSKIIYNKATYDIVYYIYD